MQKTTSELPELGKGYHLLRVVGQVALHDLSAQLAQGLLWRELTALPTGALRSSENRGAE